MSKTSYLRLTNASASYGKQKIFSNISLSLSSGTITGLIGPSGSGKTTLLRCLKGFKSFEAGELTTDLHSSDFGYIFQSPHLLPWLTVWKNIMFRQRHTIQNEIKAEKFLAEVQLNSAKKKLPHELSGGMKQRVQLARSLMNEPKILLMDEPFSGLDPELRANMYDVLKKICRHHNVAILITSHHQDELKKLCHQVISL